jgi:DNA (cytosine-5)-methyltransferase 1
VPQIRERMYMIGQLGGLNGFEWPKPQTNGSELSIKDVLDKKTKEDTGLSKQVIDCLKVWQEFIMQYPKDEQLPSFPIWSMEFKATYPYEIDSIYDVKMKELRKKKGIFGKKLDFWFRKDLMERLPSYARYKEGAFPKWKQIFIKQNRNLYKKNRRWIDSWLPKIQIFPPSLQKFEWNCKGEKRNIWDYVIQFRASGVRVKRPTTAPSLVAMTTTQIPIIGWEKRYMTVRECARLQSMDKLKHLPKGNAAMTALGNAVNVKVAQLVLKNLLSSK